MTGMIDFRRPSISRSTALQYAFVGCSHSHRITFVDFSAFLAAHNIFQIRMPPRKMLKQSRVVRKYFSRRRHNQIHLTGLTTFAVYHKASLILLTNPQSHKHPFSGCSLIPFTVSSHLCDSASVQTVLNAALLSNKTLNNLFNQIFCCDRIWLGASTHCLDYLCQALFRPSSTLGSSTG